MLAPYPSDAFESYSEEPVQLGCVRLIVSRRALQLSSGLVLEWPGDDTISVGLLDTMSSPVAEYMRKYRLHQYSYVMLHGEFGWASLCDTPSQLGLQDGAQISIFVSEQGHEGDSCQPTLCWWAQELPIDYRGDLVDSSLENEEHAGESLSSAQIHVGRERWQLAISDCSQGLASTHDGATRAGLFTARSRSFAALHSPLAALRDANAAVLLGRCLPEAVACQAEALEMLAQYTEARFCHKRAGRLEFGARFWRQRLKEADIETDHRWQESLRQMLRYGKHPIRQIPSRASQEVIDVCQKLQQAQNPKLYQHALSHLREWLNESVPHLDFGSLEWDGSFGSATPWCEVLRATFGENVSDTSDAMSGEWRLCTSFLSQPFTMLYALYVLGVRIGKRIVIHAAGARESHEDGNGFEYLGGDAKWDVLNKIHPTVEFHLVLVGPDMVGSSSSTSVNYGTGVTIHRSHQRYEDLSVVEDMCPDVVLCQNIGIHTRELFAQWWPALCVMLDRGLPVAFTMFDEAEWQSTMFLLYEAARIRLEVIYTGRNPFGSLNFAMHAVEKIPFSPNQWLLVFRGCSTASVAGATMPLTEPRFR